MLIEFVVAVVAGLVAYFGYNYYQQHRAASPVAASGNSSPPVGNGPGSVQPPAPTPVTAVTLPAGVIGQPNADLLVQVQAVETARAQYANDPNPINKWWAANLPHWWGVEEVANLFPAAVGTFLFKQCNAAMLKGALAGNDTNSKMWTPWISPPNETVKYASPLDAAVVAGSNPLPSGQGFAGIKIADFPALLEANRQVALAHGAVPVVVVAGPSAGPGRGAEAGH